jgi:hypothetical protein
MAGSVASRRTLRGAFCRGGGKPGGHEKAALIILQNIYQKGCYILQGLASI